MPDHWSWDPSAPLAVDGTPTGRPLIIAHRGACGMFPEHTRRSYEEGAEQGGDYVECDLSITKVGDEANNRFTNYANCHVPIMTIMCEPNTYFS